MTNLLNYPYSILRPIYEKTSFHKSVITDLEDSSLRHAYAHCRMITRAHAKTFYMATRFLPNHKQRGVFAIYALCRYLDNLVDEAEDLMQSEKIPSSDIIKKLDSFTADLMNAYEGIEEINPILTAFTDSMNRFKFNSNLPLLLIEGVKTDLVKNRYNTFDELYDYSYKVASVVGLMTSEVFGYSDDTALDYAVDLGIAMQLTNILRDVGEDLSKNRIYLPADELEFFKISENQLFGHEISPAFIEMMKFQIDRARNYYKKADRGIALLSPDSRLPVALARQNYSRILTKIEENRYNVFKHRAYLNSAEKLSILPGIIYSLGSDGYSC